MESLKRSPLKIALLEFFIVLGCEFVWTFVRHNGTGLIDAVGIAAITGLLTYAWARN